MPDFMLVFAITVLAHHPDFESTQDVDFLKRYFFLEEQQFLKENTIAEK